MEEKYLRVNEVANYLSMGVTTIWDKAKHNKDGFPSGRKVSPRMTIWKRSDLDNWVNRNTVNEVE